jgi:hypothetical protein
MYGLEYTLRFRIVDVISRPHLMDVASYGALDAGRLTRERLRKTIIAH